MHEQERAWSRKTYPFGEGDKNIRVPRLLLHLVEEDDGVPAEEDVALELPKAPALRHDNDAGVRTRGTATVTRAEDDDALLIIVVDYIISTVKAGECDRRNLPPSSARSLSHRSKAANRPGTTIMTARPSPASFRVQSKIWVDLIVS